MVGSWSVGWRSWCFIVCLTRLYLHPLFPVAAGTGGYDEIHQPGEPGCVPPSYCRPARHRHVLYRLVFCVSFHCLFCITPYVGKWKKYHFKLRILSSVVAFLHSELPSNVSFTLLPVQLVLVVVVCHFCQWYNFSFISKPSFTFLNVYYRKTSERFTALSYLLRFGTWQHSGKKHKHSDATNSQVSHTGLEQNDTSWFRLYPWNLSHATMIIIIIVIITDLAKLK